MKYIDEYRDKKKVLELSEEISKICNNSRIALMEVCGTHTQAFFRYGIRDILSKNIKIVSGPGCPVCVSANSFLDKAIAYSRVKGVIIATFGDMLRVPGSSSTLEKEKAKGADIRVVYSVLDALKTAEDNENKNVIFLGVGFETTTPLIASSIQEAKEKRISNYFVLSAHKLIPPAMKALAESKELNIGGFICPGHVSAIIGSLPYRFIASEYKIPCVIAGFEPLDIIQSIYMLVKQIRDKKPEVQIQYRRSVKEIGNPRAVGIMYDVFEVEDCVWRGLGIIPKSGLRIKNKYSNFNPEGRIRARVEKSRENPGCICGEVLCGAKTPDQCPLFGDKCNPFNPIGACMVSLEGTCAAYYKYR